MNVLQRQPGSDRGPQRPLAVNILSREAGAIGLDEKAANFIIFVLNFGPDDSYVGDGAGGDPHLLAIQNVFLPHFASAGQHTAWIRTESWLGQSEAAQLFAFLHRRKPGLLLLFTA